MKNHRAIVKSVICRKCKDLRPYENHSLFSITNFISHDWLRHLDTLYAYNA